MARARLLISQLQVYYCGDDEHCLNVLRDFHNSYVWEGIHLLSVTPTLTPGLTFFHPPQFQSSILQATRL
jgi:hypothetical protein